VEKVDKGGFNCFAPLFQVARLMIRALSKVESWFCSTFSKSGFMKSFW
jgi:hypothetical protein